MNETGLQRRQAGERIRLPIRLFQGNEKIASTRRVPEVLRTISPAPMMLSIGGVEAQLDFGPMRRFPPLVENGVVVYPIYLTLQLVSNRKARPERELLLETHR